MRLLATVLTLLFATVAASAQEAKQFTELFYGVKACLPCHEQGTDTVFTSRKIEYKIWSKHDKHKDAALVLKNERSQQIAKIMKLPADLTNEPRCANCHGVYIDPAKEKMLIHEDTFQGEDRLASGVSCVACHGPVTEWVNEHTLPFPKKKWSARSREEKKNEFGLRDLWDPVERANLCVSCHIGNIKEGKFVTHEMYAAGHPPLPGIEIAAFSEAMPAHWESLTQKAARARSLPPDAKNGRSFLKAAYGIDADAMEMEQTRLSAIASLVTARASIRLVGDYAAAGSPWPELAFYDCYACHHDLKSKSWRIERGYAGKPGRPVVRPWPFAIVPAVDPAAVEPLVAWQALFHDTPFGDASTTAKQAKIADDVLSERIRQLKTKKFDRPSSRQVAADLINVGKSRLFDFDSARQFAWSLRGISGEVDGTFKKSARDSFRQLEKSLQLRLPEGQVEIVPTMLDDVLSRVATYDPRDFQKILSTMAPLLKGDPANP